MWLLLFVPLHSKMNGGSVLLRSTIRSILYNLINTMKNKKMNRELYNYCTNDIILC